MEIKNIFVKLFWEYISISIKRRKNKMFKEEIY